MWLLVSLVAAISATVLRYIVPRVYKLDLLSLMFWGATFMILVDHILGYEGGSFFEFETEGLVSHGIILGILMTVPVFLVWGIMVIISKPKANVQRERR